MLEFLAIILGLVVFAAVGFTFWQMLKDIR